MRGRRREGGGEREREREREKERNREREHEREGEKRATVVESLVRGAGWRKGEASWRSRTTLL